LFSVLCDEQFSGPCSSRAQALLAWYRKHARDLPWRHTVDPYHIWISEIMLQQTQVATVLPRYAAWFDVFPDIATLAAARLDAVLKAWEGLGYYRRARFIHAAAQYVVEHQAGVFPGDVDTMLKLPGIGRSTAGAISSFCFGTYTPVLDGNVKRVLARWHGLPDVKDRALWQLAQQAIDASGEPDTWNQAMMELGATACQPKPACGHCPVNGFCESSFHVAAAGAKRDSIPVLDVHWRVHLHRHAERGIWLTRRPETGIWAGLWTPPITELSEAPDMPPTHIHLLTHRRIHLYAELLVGQPEGDGQWVPDTRTLALPTGIHRLLEKHGG